MPYKVIKRFMDLEDDNFIYEEGWDFPRANHFVNEARIKELASDDNRQGIPLIEKVGEVKQEIAEPEIKEEIVEEIVEEEINEEIVEPVEAVKEEVKPNKARKKKE